MKRYLLFAGEESEALGGWADLIRDGDSIEELLPEKKLGEWWIAENGQRCRRSNFGAKASSDPDCLPDTTIGWFHVVDLETGNIVREDYSESEVEIIGSTA